MMRRVGITIGLLGIGARFEVAEEGAPPRVYELSEQELVDMLEAHARKSCKHCAAERDEDDDQPKGLDHAGD